MASEEFEATVEAGTMTITCESFRPLLEMGTCVGFAKVRFKTAAGSIVIDNFRLLKSARGELFVGLPSHKKGEKFYDDVEVTEDLKKLLAGVVKRGYQNENR